MEGEGQESWVLSHSLFMGEICGIKSLLDRHRLGIFVDAICSVALCLQVLVVVGCLLVLDLLHGLGLGSSFGGFLVSYRF